MQQKVVLCLALVCLAALPLFNARSLLEEGDLASLATAALESGKAMTAEESMLMQASGGYGAGAMAGGYGNSAGGILDTPAPDTAAATPAASTGLEAGEGTTSSTKPAAAAPAATKSAASSAAKSTGLAVAFAVVFLSAFLL